MQYFLREYEAKHEENNNVYVMAMKYRGDFKTQDIDVVKVKNSDRLELKMACALLPFYRCACCVEAASEEEGRTFMRENIEEWIKQTTKSPIQYPIDELHLIRWSDYDMQHSARSYKWEVEKVGGRCLEMIGQPAADCTVMLFHLKGKLPEIPKFEFHGETFEHEVLGEDMIRACYDRWIEEK